METTTIIYIVVAAIVGAAIAYFLTPKGGNGAASEEKDALLAEKEKQNQTELRQKEALLSEAKEQAAANKKMADQMKEKYNSLESETYQKIETLNKQLKDALKGNVDPEIIKNMGDSSKYQAEIKKLKEEIEDLEDDIDDQKSKLKKRENELNKTISDKENENKKLVQEIAAAKEELEIKAEELNTKMQALDFVKEILTADVISDKAMQSLYENVDDIATYVQMDVRDSILSSGFKLNSEWENYYLKEGLYKWMVTTKKSWIAGKTSIAFVGEFSAGKTSIVNRILSQDQPGIALLPTSTKATTAIPTYISGGVKTNYAFFTPDNQLKNLSETTFKRISKEVLGQVEGISELIRYFVMTYKNPNLDKLSILDTPGFNSNDPDDANRTIEVINECDALFWVFDVNAGTVNKSSINTIKGNLHKPLYVVINKVDTKPSSEVDRVQKLIEQTLVNEGIKVEQYIRFSSKEPLNNIMVPIQNIKNKSSNAYDDYIGNLKDTMSWHVDQCENLMKECSNNYKEAEKISTQWDQQFNQQMSNMADACNEAASIPHFEEHWFREDGYEMSKSQYYRLQELMNWVTDTNRQCFNKIVANQKAAREDAQAQYSSLCEAKQFLKQMKECQDDLNKLLKKIGR